MKGDICGEKNGVVSDGGCTALHDHGRSLCGQLGLWLVFHGSGKTGGRSCDTQRSGYGIYRMWLLPDEGT